MTAIRVACPVELDQESGRALLEAVRRCAMSQGDEVVLDLSGTQHLDSRGGGWLVEIADLVRARRGEVRCEGQQGNVATFIGMLEPALAGGSHAVEEPPSFLVYAGEAWLKFTAEVKEFATLLVDTIYWTVIGPFEGRGFRWNLFFDEMYEMGVRGVRINLLMNFLLGLIIAMLSAAQLQYYGVSILVANLVVIAFLRELAALMTAVVVSARTGAAIAAELATMKVQEEVDALRSMGLNVTQFLVAPKVLALLIVLPCLTAMGMLAGIMGGAVWGIVVLGYRPDMWLLQTHASARYADAFQGLSKAVVFAIAIVLVGCHNGLRVKGGSRGVGLMTTRAVVMDIFLIVVIDMIFAVFYYYILPAPALV